MDFLSSLVPQTPQQWAVVLTTGGIVALLLQILAHYTGLKDPQKDARKLLTFLATAGALLGTYADKILVYGNTNPKLILALNLGWVFTFATLWHRFAISPAYHSFMDYVNGIRADALAHRASLVAAQQAAALADPSQPQYEGGQIPPQ